MGVSSTSVSRTRSTLPSTLNTRWPASFSIQKSSPIAKSFSCMRYLFVPPRDVLAAAKALHPFVGSIHRTLRHGSSFVDDESPLDSTRWKTRRNHYGLHDLVGERLLLVVP